MARQTCLATSRGTEAMGLSEKMIRGFGREAVRMLEDDEQAPDIFQACVLISQMIFYLIVGTVLVMMVF